MEQPVQVRTHQQVMLTDVDRRQQSPAVANVQQGYYNNPVADNQQRQPGQEVNRPVGQAGRAPYGSDYYYEDNGPQYSKMGVQYANQGQQQTATQVSREEISVPCRSCSARRRKVEQ